MGRVREGGIRWTTGKGRERMGRGKNRINQKNTAGRFQRLGIAVCAASVWMASLCFAQIRTDVPDLFLQANEAYTQQEFTRAVDLYEEILGLGRESGPVYYNLGNAYFRAGDVGRAVLNYERALTLIPRDPDLRANYRYARSLAGRTQGEDDGNVLSRIFTGLFRLQTFDEICWIMMILVCVLAAVHLCGLYGGWKDRHRMSVILLISAGVLLYAAGLIWKMGYLSGRAVILAQTSAYFEPRDAATVHFSLYEGDRVRIVDADGPAGWERIRRFDGKIGWIKDGDVEPIITSGRR